MAWPEHRPQDPRHDAAMHAPGQGRSHHDDLATRRIAWIGGGIVATVAAVIAVALAWLHDEGLPPGGAWFASRPTIALPGAVLQSAPQLDRARDRARQGAILEGRGWTDATHTHAHVTIGDAMRLLVARAALLPAGQDLSTIVSGAPAAAASALAAAASAPTLTGSIATLDAGSITSGRMPSTGETLDGDATGVPAPRPSTAASTPAARREDAR
jgi:hypothetical protein